jgi:hypothetical protein
MRARANTHKHARYAAVDSLLFSVGLKMSIRPKHTAVTHAPSEHNKCAVNDFFRLSCVTLDLHLAEAQQEACLEANLTLPNKTKPLISACTYLITKSFL